MNPDCAYVPSALEPAWELRKLVPADIDALVALENASQLLPWSQSMLCDELLHPDASVLGAFCEGGLWGFVALRLMSDELWVMNVATHPQMRRRGLARALLKTGMDTPEFSQISACWLEVRSGNQTAQALYASLGFEEMGLRTEYYPPLPGTSERENAVIMRRVMNNKDSF